LQILKSYKKLELSYLAYDTILVTVLSATISILFFTGLYCSDDINYTKMARFLAGVFRYRDDIGKFDTYFRMAMIFPYGMFLKMFPNIKLYFTPIYFSIVFTAICLSVYYITYQWTGRYYALVASILTITNPLLFIYSGAVLPDNPISLMLLWSVFFWGCYLKSSIEETKKINVKKMLLLVAAGFLAIMVYTMKEVLLCFFLPLSVLTIIKVRKMTIRNIAITAAFLISGVLLGLIIDCLLSFIYFGRPLARLEAILQDEELMNSFKAFMAQQGKTFFQRLAYALYKIDEEWKFFPYYWGPVFAGIIIHVLAKFKKNQLHFIAVVSTAAFIFLFNTFASVSLKEYIGIPIQARYYAPMTPLLMVGLTMALKIMYEFIIGTGLIKIGGIFGFLPAISKVIVLVLVVLVAFIQVDHNLLNAGNIYRASDYRNFHYALGVVKEVYPKTRLIADAYFTSRVLIYEEDIPVKSYIENGKNSPKGQFIYLTKKSLEKPDVVLENLKAFEDKNLSVNNITQNIGIRPWGSRWDAMLTAFGRGDLANKKDIITEVYMVKDNRENP
jgi:hypothetical protein